MVICDKNHLVALLSRCLISVRPSPLPSFVEKTEYVCALIQYFSFPVLPNLNKNEKGTMTYILDPK